MGAETVKTSLRKEDRASEKIKYLSTLPVLQYEQQRESAAENLGIRVSVLDKEVALAKPKEEINNAFFEPVVPWDNPVDGRILVFEIVDVFNRFSVLPNGTAMAASLWTILTYCFDLWLTLPILGVLSPEKRCGKSTFMTTLDCLCFKSLSASNISPAAFFRVIELHRPCLLIDEGDTFLKENEVLRGVINSGHTRTQAYVVRCDGENNDPVKFTTWAPKAIAMIGKLPGTIEDRSVIVSLKRKLPSEHAERHTSETRQELSIIKQKISRFVEDNSEALKKAIPARLHSTNDRQADNWEPLLAIAQVAGVEEEARSAALFFLDVTEKEMPLSVQLLLDLNEVFKDKHVERMFSAELVANLVAFDDRPWAEWSNGRPMSTNALAKSLKRFGIQPKLLRIGDETKRGYEHGWFLDPLSRYVGK